jgi:hypothetical protein
MLYFFTWKLIVFWFSRDFVGETPLHRARKNTRPSVFYEQRVCRIPIAAGASMENEVGAHVGSALKFLINSWVQINLRGRSTLTKYQFLWWKL